MKNCLVYNPVTVNLSLVLPLLFQLCVLIILSLFFDLSTFTWALLLFFFLIFDIVLDFCVLPPWNTYFSLMPILTNK